MASKIINLIILLAFLSLALLAGAAIDNALRKSEVVKQDEKFLCLVPYTPEYCKANQAHMYREQATRAR